MVGFCCYSLKARETDDLSSSTIIVSDALSTNHTRQSVEFASSSDSLTKVSPSVL